MAPIWRLSSALISLLVGHVIVLASAVGLRSSSPKLQQQQRASQVLIEKRAAASSGSWVLRQLNAPAAGSSGRRLRHDQATSIQVGNTSVSQCILLFGAFCNGEYRVLL